VHSSEESDESSVWTKVDPATWRKVDTRRVDSSGSAVGESTHRTVLRIDDEEFRVHRGGEASHDRSRIFRVGIELVGNSNESSSRFAVLGRNESATF
jgi:hypothetical protein